MSTVASLEIYHEIRGIADEITLVNSDSHDWELVTERVGKAIAAQYGCAFVWIPRNYADVKMIWACERSTPWLDAYCELIYSDSQSWQAKHAKEIRESIEESRHSYHVCWTPWTGDSDNPTKTPAKTMEEAREIAASELEDSISSLYWSYEGEELERIKSAFDGFDATQHFATADYWDCPVRNEESPTRRPLLGDMWIESCDWEDCEVGEEY